jgi:hypothetical protein
VLSEPGGFERPFGAAHASGCGSVRGNAFVDRYSVALVKGSRPRVATIVWRRGITLETMISAGKAFGAA